MFIPEGYGTVFPYMIVDDAEALTDFLVEVFGGVVQGKTVMPDGRIANTRIRIGTSTFMIGQSDGEGIKPMPASYYIYVEDVDAAYKAAIEHGATTIFEPADMAYEDRQAGVTDPTGNAWWISRRLVEAPYDEK